jgi:hypothetical protein
MHYNYKSKLVIYVASAVSQVLLIYSVSGLETDVVLTSCLAGDTIIKLAQFLY